MLYQDKPPIDELMHFGTKFHSGRWPYGSGDNPYQHSGDFLSRIQKLRDKGLSETEIARSFKLSTKQYRTQKALANYDRRSNDLATARSLKADGLSNAKIAEKLGYPNESSVRSLFNEQSEARMNQALSTAEFLMDQVDKKGMLAISKGVSDELRISKEKLDEALYILELEGYPTYPRGVSQMTNPGKQTNIKVLCPPGTEHKDAYNDDKISSVTDYISRDDGKTFEKSFKYPESMDSSRLKIRYAEDGGVLKDGIVELRRGVEDLSLGESRYSQVRILVDKDRYIKGMAVYADKMPDGVDVIFNTNKPKDVPMRDVLKKIEDDPDNPFGSVIKEHGGQYTYIDKNGKEKLGLINKRADEGDWSEWKDKLPSQFLSKQSTTLAKKQLGLAIDDKVAEYNEILSCTNPTVKKALLTLFSDDCDSSAVHLYAAALPRQKYHVIMPVNSVKETEVYAPGYNNGEKVALIRYPHGGTFEIPILTVNNKQQAAKKLLGATTTDAIAINKKVADRLSGADFDGDTVMVIPTNSKTKITSTPALKELEGFDPTLSYGGKKPGTFKKMKNTQNEMGSISNLITDMTLKGATQEELARAVKHSMVVIDAEKHGLDYRQSAKDNNIDGLKKLYQQHTHDDKSGGASTLISRAKSEATVYKRQGQPKVNIKGEKWYDPNKPEGSLIYKTTDKLWYQERYKEDTKDHKKGELKFNKDGSPKMKARTDTSTKMAETDDARSLISDMNTPMERIYADYANKMKALGNQARKEAVAVKETPRNKGAVEKYNKEVSSLNAKLNKAKLNKPKETYAQILANSTVNAKIQANPELKKDKEHLKKAKNQAINDARLIVGADGKNTRIVITDNEWEAIQAGAISKTKLSAILSKADMDVVKQLATPRTTASLTPAKISKIAAMNASGMYSLAEIAKSIGVSSSTVSKYLKGVN